MNTQKTLKQKIIHSVFVYETKKTTFETFSKIGVLFLSFIIIVIFGGVTYDIYTENELGDVLVNIISKGEYSFMKMKELLTIIFNEIPNWILFTYLFGITLGCILLVLIIKNWSLVIHKVRSLFHYWFNL